ncbi:hypothetical protein [Brevundimonas sp.]|uniref:hypothetical protein n=1 Tax=Brevundimonas sp. TaxID=1871086 RepID=UPI0025B9B7EA|nr:hypothetical protein [Brevundimonas sp.]
MARAPNGYRKSVFINAPFSDDRRPVFNAIVFSVQACGFAPRCARELDDAGQVRMDKISDLVRDCQLGIHDISYMELDDGLPRFNMPFELGVYLGARRFGEGWVGRKVCTIFDREPFRYQRALSDIAGQDIRAHNCDPRRASDETRDWLAHQTRRDERVPGAAVIWAMYEAFCADLPALAEAALQEDAQLTFNERRYFASEWLAMRL